jgi:hypothetical protein
MNEALRRIQILNSKNIFMEHTARLSKLMRLSWQVQKKRRITRSKALQAAWAIVLTEDITVQYLVKKHSHEKYPNKVAASTLTLFQ